MTTLGPSNASSAAITDHLVETARSICDRSSIVGLRQHGHPLREICPAVRRHTLEEKFADAAQVHQLSGASPSMAMHVLWDFPNGLRDVAKVRDLSRHYGIRAGAINPNLFESQNYKFGSFGNPDPAIRQQARRSRTGIRRHRPRTEQRRCFAVVRRRIQLSRHAKHAPPHRLVSGGIIQNPRSAGTRAAHAGRVQAI